MATRRTPGAYILVRPTKMDELATDEVGMLESMSPEMLSLLASSVAHDAKGGMAKR